MWGASKSLSSVSFNNNGSSKQLTTIYSNINGSSKKIFPVEQTIYTWKKYVSYISNTESTKTWPNPDKNFFSLSSSISVNKIPGSDFFTKSGNKYTITAYSDYSYSETEGKFTLTNAQSFVYTYYSRYSDCEWSPSNAESTLCGMYLPYSSYLNENTQIFRIESFHTPDNADSSHYFIISGKSHGNPSTTYTYTYSYKEDGTVTSTNQYAYSTSGNTLSYISNSNNDIRTVYVRV